MSDDLINREKALEIVKRHMCDSANIERGILELPIAYDVENVIEHLKAEGCIVNDDSGNRAVEIIREGALN